MSRIGRAPVPLPSGVELKLDAGILRAKGTKGELTWKLPQHVKLNVEGQVATISVENPDERQQRALWGLSRVLVANMVKGVTEGFVRKLELHGVGYRAEVKGKDLVLQLGFSHPITFTPPAGIAIAVEKNVITITGIDKQIVGEVAATIRRFRKPEPYKGKGIRYNDEVVRRKAGKVVKAAGAK